MTQRSDQRRKLDQALRCELTAVQTGGAVSVAERVAAWQIFGGVIGLDELSWGRYFHEISTHIKLSCGWDQRRDRYGHKVDPAVKMTVERGSAVCARVHNIRDRCVQMDQCACCSSTYRHATSLRQWGAAASALYIRFLSSC